jgi:hypothetical protein
MRKSTIVLSAILAFVLIVTLTIGGWQLGWWLKSYGTNRDAQILQDTYGRQNALVEQIYTDMKEAEIAGIPPGQRVAIINQLCDAAAKLTGSIQLSLSAQRYVALECTTP